jgi:hypothetical protein
VGCDGFLEEAASWHHDSTFTKRLQSEIGLSSNGLLGRTRLNEKIARSIQPECLIGDLPSPTKMTHARCGGYCSSVSLALPNELFSTE